MSRPSLRLILIAAFAIVCALPILALAGWTYYSMKSHTLQEARDQNQVLSQNLATPIHTYLTSARQTLSIIKILITHEGDPDLTVAVAANQNSFDTVVYLSQDGVMRRWPETAVYYSAGGDAALLAQAQPLFKLHREAHSGVIRNPYTGAPSMLFMQTVPHGYVVGLLNLKPIMELGRRIKFGERGHAVITDQYGRLVLHPNNKWIDEMHSIGDWPIIQAGLRGGTGVARLCHTCHTVDHRRILRGTDLWSNLRVLRHSGRGNRSYAQTRRNRGTRLHRTSSRHRAPNRTCYLR